MGGTRRVVRGVDVKEVAVGVSGQRGGGAVVAVRASVGRAVGLPIAGSHAHRAPRRAAVVGEREVRMDPPAVVLVVARLREGDVPAVRGCPRTASKVVPLVVGDPHEREALPAVVRNGDPAVAVARPVHVDVHVLPIRRHRELRLVRPRDRHRDGDRPRPAVIVRPRVHDARRIALQPDRMDGAHTVHLDDRVVLPVRDVGAATEESIAAPRPPVVERDAEDDARHVATAAATRQRVAGRERVDERSVRIRRDRGLPIVVGRAPDVLDRPPWMRDRADRTLEVDVAERFSNPSNAAIRAFVISAASRASPSAVCSSASSSSSFPSSVPSDVEGSRWLLDRVPDGRVGCRTDVRRQRRRRRSPASRRRASPPTSASDEDGRAAP